LVRPDFLADLILAQGDPAENVSILQEPQRLLMIMKDGAIVSDRTRSAYGGY
jgi:imidazolonepropionase-like amidohydrolase